MEMDCSAIGMKMSILKTGAQTGGRSLEMEWEILPVSGGPPVHLHPSAVETYEIRSGEMEFFIDGRWIPAKAGDQIRVEAGQAHTFRNRSGQPVRLLNTHQPAQQFEGFFRGLHAFAQSGLVRDGKMTLKAVLGISTLYSNYPAEILAVKPPAGLMRILARVGRWVGLNFK